MAGVRIGLDKLHYAVMTDETTETYATPKPIPGAIEATITPTTNTATLFADDQADEVATSLGGIEVSLNVKDLPPEIRAELLGAKVNADGVLIESKDDVPPYVALGFRSLKSNGKYRYFWLYKGKFQLSEETFATRTDTPEFQTPTVTAQFVPRAKDGRWRAWVDEDGTSVDPTVITNWFNAVYEESVDSGGESS